MDHYQTPLQVHVSAFAKGADKSKSKVVFETTQVSFHHARPRGVDLGFGFGFGFAQEWQVKSQLTD